MQHQNRDNEYTMTEATRQTVLDGRQSLILNRIDATGANLFILGTCMLGPRQAGFC